MDIENATCVYVAATNVDANLIGIFLNDSGIDALVVEDNSAAALYSMGAMAELHRPKIFVEAMNVDAARTLISRYESTQRKTAEADQPEFCYFCGANCEANATTCPKCGESLEAERSERADEDLFRADQSETHPTTVEELRRFRKPIVIAILTPVIMMGVIAGSLVVRQLVWLILRR